MSSSQGTSRSSSDGLWNALTTIVLALTVLVLIYYTVIFISPGLAPFGSQSEPTAVALLNTPTPKPTLAITDTPLPAPATWTPEATRTPEPTSTIRPPRSTRTPRPTVFFTPVPSETPTPMPTRHPWPFRLSDEGITYMRYPFSSECNWLGIAGEVLAPKVEQVPDTTPEAEQVPGITPEPEHVLGIAVVLNGGGLENVVTQSGQAPDYAPSGWEHFVDNKIKEGTFLIQLWHKGQPVSEQVEVRTRRDCRANLAYLIFEKAWENWYP